MKGTSMEIATGYLSDRQQQVNGQASDIAVLRHHLKQLNVWPDAADEYLALLSVSRWHTLPLTDDDAKWLLSAAEDSIQGVDIGARYPAFFQKLLTNATLCQAFLKELERKSNQLRIDH